MGDDDHGERLDRLRASVNDAARNARNGFITYLLISAYLAVTIAATTDEQLLRKSEIALPPLDLGMPVVGSYMIIPWLFLLVYLNLLLSFRALSRKLCVFDNATKDLSGWSRLEERSQLVAFPLVPVLLQRNGEGDAITRVLVQPLAWLLVMVLPVGLLMWMQVRFLPYHDESITLLHRITVLIDFALVWTFWPIVVSSSGRWLDWWEQRVGDGLGRTAFAFVSFLLTAGAAFFTIYVAVIPGDLRNPASPSEKIASALLDSFNLRILVLSEKTLVQQPPSPELIAAYHLSKLSVDQAWADHAKEIDLQQRDLRFANFRGARLVADFRGANLEGAAFIEADVRLANFAEFELPGQTPKPTILNNAFFNSANILGADLRGAQLQGANLRRAQLQGANLSRAQLQGANLSRAQLQGADLSRAQLQGADFRYARLQGANFRFVQLQGADLRFAQLQGADLESAQLQSADLTRAQLQGAILVAAQLQGADLNRAQLQGADLSNASLWKARFEGAVIDLSDLREAEFDSMSDEDIDSLRKNREAEIPDAAMLERALGDVKERLGSDKARENTLDKARKPQNIIYDDSLNVPDWPRSLEERKYHRQLAPFLIDLACTDKYIAQGIARRAIPRFFQRTFGEPISTLQTALARGLLADPCASVQSLPEATKATLRAVVGRAESQD